MEGIREIMDECEARAWLNGERSNINTFLEMEPDPDNRVHTLAMIAVADAADYWKALAVVKYREGKP